MATSATTSSTSSAPRATVAIIATLGAVVLAVIAELIVNQFTLTDVAEHSIGHAVLAFGGILLLAAVLKTWHATPTPYGRSARKVLLAGLIGGISGLAIESAAEVCTDMATGSLGLVTVATASSAYRTSQIDANLGELVRYDPALEPYLGF